MSNPLPSDRLYFAYGSNLSLAQMSRRCPDSIFIGRGTLRGYRWQINERGFANVVPVPAAAATTGGDVDPKSTDVHGLLYAIGLDDEESLDLSEGVSSRCYEKHELEVDFHPSTMDAAARRLPSAEVLTLLDAERASRRTNDRQDQAAVGTRPDVTALVYVSTEHVADGPIRREYVGRMERAIADALDLGVPAEFVEGVMVPLIRGARK